MNILTKIIETPKAKILVVGGLPEDAMIKQAVRGKLNIQVNSFTDITIYKYNIPPGNWQLLGKLNEITEDVANELVDNPNENGDYCDYVYDPDESYWQTETAKESLLSLVEANVKMKNKYGNEPPSASEMFDGVSNMEHADNFEAWQAEEETVFTNPIIFIEK